MTVKMVNEFEKHHATIYEGTACANCAAREKCRLQSIMKYTDNPCNISLDYESFRNIGK